MMMKMRKTKMKKRKKRKRRLEMLDFAGFYGVFLDIGSNFRCMDTAAKFGIQHICFWIFLDRLFDEKMPKLSSISKSRRSMISSFSVRKISADFLTKLAGGISNQKHCRGIGS